MSVLREIEQYILRTGVAPSAFGRKVVNDASLVNRLLKGSICGEGVAQKCRAFMRRHPNGFGKQNFKPRLRAMDSGLKLSDAKIIADRTPCFKCGVRRDYGCEHWPLEQGSAA
jgi:hypothetical protein